jgi:hypothetical protein
VVQFGTGVAPTVKVHKEDTSEFFDLQIQQGFCIGDNCSNFGHTARITFFEVRPLTQ